jgi:hypothetical protein
MTPGAPHQAFGGLTAHLILILGMLHSHPVLVRLAADGPERVAAALRTMVQALLDAPLS